MKKRLLSILLTLCMTFSLLPASAFAASFDGGMTAQVITQVIQTSSAATENREILWLFANGKKITIEAKGTGTIIKMDNTEIDLAAVTKDTSIKPTKNGDNSYDLSRVTICGGSYVDVDSTTTLTADTSITMNGGKVGMLVGGCYTQSSFDTILKGNTSITVNGGKVGGYDIIDYLAESGPGGIVGGGYRGSDAAALAGAIVTGSTTVTVNGGEVHGIVGGGCGQHCRVGGDTNVTIKDGKIHRGYFAHTYVSGSLQTATSVATFVGGGMGEDANVGSTHVTITGGDFTGDFVRAYVGGYYTEGHTPVNAVTGNAYLTITGGTFSGGTTSKIFSKTGTQNTTSNTYYYINTALLPTDFYLEGDAPFQLLTNQPKTQNVNRYDKPFIHQNPEFKGSIPYIYINERTETYTFYEGNNTAAPTATAYSIGMDYTIPKDYSMTIPEGYTLTIPKGVTITNNGAISIEGTLKNNGTISGTGSIVKVDKGEYTGGSPATDKVPSAARGFTLLKFEKGTNRGDTQISDIDALTEVSNTRYYTVTTTKPVAPVPDAVINTEGMKSVTENLNIPVALNDWVGVYEVNSTDNKIVKFSCVQMTTETIKENTAVDTFLEGTVSAGATDGKTKITATAESGNGLYYDITNAKVENLFYNSVIATTGKTEVPKTDIDTQKELNRFLNVYEVTKTGYLRTFVSVKLTELNVKHPDGGLVAVENGAEKIIYCGGATVAYSGEKHKRSEDTEFTEQNNAVIKPELYVLIDGKWEKAVPKGFTSTSYEEYTLKGGTKEDHTTAAGTLYILGNDDIVDSGNNNTSDKTEAKASADVVKVDFYAVMPKAAVNFKNFIIPDLANEKRKTENDWKYIYTVGGEIDLANAKKDHLKVTKQLSTQDVTKYETTYPVKMSSLTIKEGGKLTLPDLDDPKITNGSNQTLTTYETTTVYFSGKATDINGATDGKINIIFTPHVDVKLYDKNGNPFPMAQETFDGKPFDTYKVSKDQDVTVVAVISTSGIAATPPTQSQTPVQATPNQIPIQTDYLDMTEQYAIGFSTRNVKEKYDYYIPQEVTYSNTETDGVDKVTTLTLTISAKDFSKQLYQKDPKRMLCVYNNNILTGKGQPPKYSTHLKDVYVTVTKCIQPDLKIIAPKTVTYGDEPFTLGTSGGGGTGGVTWTKSSNETVATVDENGKVTVKGVGSTKITATKAEDVDYFAKEAEYTLVVKKKPISGAVTIDVANGTGSVDKIDQGDTLTANIAAISPTGAKENGFTYQWYREEEVITYANQSTYKVTADDKEKILHVVVTAKAGGNYSGTVTSEKVEVGKEPLAGSISITGNTAVGDTLTLDKTKLSPTDATFTIKWQRDGSNITGATAETYKLTKADLGKTITVVITGTGTFTGSLAAAKPIPPIKPDKPVLTATAGNGQVALNWTPPFDGGSAISSYQLTVTPDITGNPFTIAGSASSYTVTGLTNGTEYGFVLSATNGEGGTASDPQKATPKAPPSGGDGDSNPTTVTVPVSSDGGTVSVSASVSGGTATIAVTDKQLASIASTGTVTMDLSGLKNVDSAKIPAKVITAVNTATGSKGLEIVLPTGTVKLDETALTSVASGNQNVMFSMKPVNTSALTTAQKESLGDKIDSAVVVDINILLNDTKVTSFNGGTLTMSVPYTPKTGEDTSKLTVWHVKDDGTVEKMGGKYDAKNKCFAFDTTHLSRYVLVSDPRVNPFTDVAADAYYYDAVLWAKEKGITGGTSATTFSPEDTCTRAQAVTFLWRSMGSPEPKNTNCPFTDVNAGEYYYKAVLWAVEKGITDGTTATTFSPDDTVSRGQVATFLWRAAGKPATSAVNPFTDVSSDDYFADAVLWAVDRKITDGTTATTFSPANGCSRAQNVTFLYRNTGK